MNIESIFREHYDHLYNSALRMSGTHEDAQDLVQETMIVAWQKLATCRGPSSLRGWLYRILLNKFRMQARRPKREYVNYVQLENTPVPVRTGQVDARLTLAKILPELWPQYRALLTAHYLQEMTCEEIATAKRVTRGYVRGGLCRARVDARLVFSEPANPPR